MSSESDSQYSPTAVEARSSQRWLDAKAFAAHPDDRADRYVVMMPLPNVTGALHMGHAMDNVMQDLLTRWHRMKGDNTLWMAGTDHAGIATQSVVETRLFELEGKTRHDIGRDALVERIWEWKDQYQARIVAQQQAMGCGCDWDRQRFTMDDVCARAVRRTFFSMFRDGLIYQGDRLVNWDCHLQTAVADDELYRETVQGTFTYIRYPVVDPQPGEPEHVVVATTRPETMLGDTAVACHGDPKGALEKALAEAREKLATVGEKDSASAAHARADGEAEVERLEKRIAEHLPHLEQVAAMAKAGRKVLLPLMDREIPLICDEWAKPELGTGCVKITPAHDPNDYAVWQRHQDTVEILNILEPDGTIHERGGAYAGQERFAARKQIVADLEAKGLIERIEERTIEVEHSDRSKTVVEPYLSKQWFVRMSDVDGGITMGRGTPREFTTPGLAQAAMDAVDGKWQSPSGRHVQFHPDQERYRRIYDAWLGEKRDWCISRQLWWGHRIPAWTGTMSRGDLLGLRQALESFHGREDVAAWVMFPDDTRLPALDALDRLQQDPDITRVQVQVCFRDPELDDRMGPVLRMGKLEQDPDVLDTWFSSSLWPHSTLGWPDPETAQQNDGQPPMAVAGKPSLLDYYYPGSCLVTGRDIITLWVARMVVMGLYNLGDVPFTDVFLHATILDGRGERMSKSKGNGIDPVDIISRYGADAMRYVVCELQTGTQDVRLPVQAELADGRVVDLAKAKAGPKRGTWVDPETKAVFDVVGVLKGHDDVLQATAISDRFEVGRNFCNKLWNAARFAFLNLEGTRFQSHTRADLKVEDRWILSRLCSATDEVDSMLNIYNPSAAVGRARDFFWNDLCDWYLEAIKPRMKDPATRGTPQQVLAFCLDQVLRLLHPFVPFITEELWARLQELAPQRGVHEPVHLAADSALLCHAPWPTPHESDRDEDLERDFAVTQEAIAAIREIRARQGVGARVPLEARIRCSGLTLESLQSCRGILQQMAFLSDLKMGADQERTNDSATGVVADGAIFIPGVVDPEQERARLAKQRDKLTKQVTGLEKKLGNPNFVAKAPADVVAKEQAALNELKSQLEGVEAGLAALD